MNAPGEAIPKSAHDGGASALAVVDGVDGVVLGVVGGGSSTMTNGELAVGSVAGTVGDVTMSGWLVPGGAVAGGVVIGGAVTTVSAAGRLSYGFGSTSSVTYSRPVP